MGKSASESRLTDVIEVAINFSYSLVEIARGLLGLFQGFRLGDFDGSPKFWVRKALRFIGWSCVFYIRDNQLCCRPEDERVRCDPTRRFADRDIYSDVALGLGNCRHIVEKRIGNSASGFDCAASVGNAFHGLTVLRKCVKQKGLTLLSRHDDPFLTVDNGRALVTDSLNSQPLFWVVYS